MKQFTSYILLTFILLATQACSNETHQAETNQLDDVAIALTYEMMNSRATTNLQGNALLSTAKVGVFALKTNRIPDYGYYNMYCTIGITDGLESIIPSTTMYFPLAPESIDVDFIAYAPYSSTYGRLQSYDFTIQANQTSDEAYIKSDLLHGVPQSGNPVHHVITHDTEQKTQNVVISFKHLLSKITFTLEPSDIVPANSLVGALVKVKQANITAPFDLSTGIIGTPINPADVTIGGITSATELTVSGIIPPQTYTGGRQVFEIVLANGTTYEYSLPSTSTLVFTGGKNYQFKMKLQSPDGGIVSNVTMTIADWQGNIIGNYTF